MNLRKCLGLVLGGLAVLVLSPSARANVYATNVRLNGGITNLSAASGTNFSISYLLNEPASQGVTIQVSSGDTSIRTLTLPSGTPGTFQGTNAVIWDGRNDAGDNPPSGVYSVSITAASTGYTNWTQITSDTNWGNIVYYGEGIAVNQNPSSPYYGRVYVAADGTAFPPVSQPPGASQGLLKVNADGSVADDGDIATGGHVWEWSSYSPWKIAISTNDSVYVSDWGFYGEVYRWDALLSATSLVQVLRADNYSATNSLGGPFVTGTGTNTLLWMSDNGAPGSPGSRGIIRYGVTADGTCLTNDLGTTVVSTDPTNLSLFPIDVAVDKNGTLYVIQDGSLAAGTWGQVNEPAVPRVLRFPAYTNGNPPDLTADWTFGGLDDSVGADGIAVDPTGTYVAVSFFGQTLGISSYTGGNTKILYATNGTLAIELDFGQTINGGTDHQDAACAWDAVGNVYYVDQLGSLDSGGAWRSFSPPGTNQATTRALATLTLTQSCVSAANSLSLSSPQDTVLPITLTGSNVCANPLTCTIIASPTNGVLSGTAPDLTYLPNTNYFGPDFFTFRVADSLGNAGYGQVAIQVTRACVSVANSMSLSALQDTPLPVTLIGSNSCSNPLLYDITVSPTNGVLSGTAPNLTYLASTNYFGSDFFVYRVRDSLGNAGFGQVTISIAAVGLATSKLTAQRQGNQVQLTLQGKPYEQFRIEASQDLTHWTPITNLIAATGPLPFVDPDAWQYPKRFYRAAWQFTAPQISSPARPGGGQFQFTLKGDLGRSYQILCSTNLVNWDILTNITPASSNSFFNDPDAGLYRARFYRARVTP